MSSRTGKPRKGKPGITIRKLMARDGYKCWLCGRYVSEANASRDHVKEVSKGGPHASWNIRLAHKKCNNDRSNPRQVLVAYTSQSEGWEAEDAPCTKAYAMLD